MLKEFLPFQSSELRLHCFAGKTYSALSVCMREQAYDIIVYKAKC